MIGYHVTPSNSQAATTGSKHTQRVGCLHAHAPRDTPRTLAAFSTSYVLLEHHKNAARAWRPCLEESQYARGPWRGLCHRGLSAVWYTVSPTMY